MAAENDMALKNPSEMMSYLDARMHEVEASLALLKAKESQLAAAPVQKAPCDPGPVGLVGFGIATTILGFIKSELLNEEDITYLCVQGFFVGGLMQLIAGILEQRSGGTFGCFCFCCFGCNWMANGTYYFFETTHIMPSVSGAVDSLKASLYFVLSCFIVIMGFRVGTYHIPMLCFTTLLFFFEVLQYGIPSYTCGKVAGWFAILGGVMALFCAGITNVNHMFGHMVINWGPYDTERKQLPLLPFLP